MPNDHGVAHSRRRKEARPTEILQAALHEFTAKGFAATRLDDIARRARISKGTIYLYFASKEELFKALLRQPVAHHIEHMTILLETFPGSMEDFLQGPFRSFQQAVFASEARHLIRLFIAEAQTFPDLTEFYFREVIEPGLAMLHRIVERGIASGEFRPTALNTFSQAFVAPMLIGLLWQALFDQYHPLDTDKLIDAYIDLVLYGLKGTQTCLDKENCR
ncbi:MAG: TetR/AcrR family transcriptional regulator [Chloroflexales bacterium]|nr:TetR/AcrR family transcriptional regulator [Chloroflexales bacterium]